MKKVATISLMFTLAVFLMVGTAMAIPVGPALQNVLNGIAVDGVNDVTATTDYLSDALDSTWEISATGGSVATFIIELAGYASTNIFGIYNGADYVPVFDGSATAGSQALMSIKADGSVFLNFADTGVDFSGNCFGYYVDSTAGGTIVNSGLWHSDTSLNADGMDHMLAYRGVGEMVQLPGLAAGPWTSAEYILAFEDLNFDIGSDADYTDLVVMVESVAPPVPEPATLLLLGVGLAGLAVKKRKTGI